MDPVSELQQRCDRNKYAITYMVTTTGTGHEPSHAFSVHVRIDENETLVCKETDTRKRSAKAKAAKSMLITLDEIDAKSASSVPIESAPPTNVTARSSEDASDAVVSSTTSHPNGSSGAASDTFYENYINALQELCQKEGYAIPTYIVEAFDDRFVCKCNIVLETFDTYADTLILYGFGTSERIAKRRAVEKAFCATGWLHL